MTSRRLMFAAGLVTGLLGALVFLASTVLDAKEPSPQLVCGDRDLIVPKLAEAYDEIPVAAGIRDSGGILEVLASPSGSWTVLLTEPGGPTCMPFSGKDWHNISKTTVNSPA